MPLLAGGATAAALVFLAAPAGAGGVAPNLYAALGLDRLLRVRPAEDALRIIPGLLRLPPPVAAVRLRGFSKT